MKQISDKQRKKNQIITKIKAELIEETGNVCRICGNYGNDTMHLMPKSMFPEYYLEPRNLVLGCRGCHNSYDDIITFRQQQTDLISQCREFAFENQINHYFKL